MSHNSKGIKWNDYKDEIVELYHQGKGSRKILSALEDKHGKFPSTNTLRQIQRLIKRWCKPDSIVDESLHRNNLESDTWKVSWVKDKETGTSTLVTNPNYVDGDIKITEDDIRDVVESVVSTKKVKKKKKYSFGQFAFRGITTDEHIGLDPNPRGDSLFGYEYDADIYTSNIDKYYNSLISLETIYGRAEVLYIDSLGDTVDGWNGQTTRGGHHLPQNMDNRDVFEIGVKAKVELLDSLINANIANQIIVRQITNDNHGGTFTWIVGKAVQMIMERLYSDDYIKFINIKRFIEHFTYGDHCFMLSHGKDDIDMKRGLPLRLDDKTVRYIRSYMDYYQVNAKYCHFDKGDLHALGYDRTKRFDYRNFMSFAPPSKWVQQNFGDTYYGYSTQVIPKHNNEIIHTNYLFEFNKL